MSPPQFQIFLVVMQSMPVIAVGFPHGCPTAPKAAVPPHCLAPPWLPELFQAPGASRRSAHESVPLSTSLSLIT